MIPFRRRVKLPMVPSGGDLRWEGMPPSKQENRHKAGQRLPLPRMRAAACHSIKTCRTHKISSLTTAVFPTIPTVLLPMIALLRHLVGWIIVAFQSREDLILENLALGGRVYLSGFESLAERELGGRHLSCFF